MLLGADIQVYTDHWNLTYSILATQHVLYWQLSIEAFDPTLDYINGVDNVVTDALSCLPMKAMVELDRIQPNVDPD